jgi:hypothetical protein
MSVDNPKAMCGDEHYRDWLAKKLARHKLTVDEALALGPAQVRSLMGIGRKAMERLYGRDWAKMMPPSPRFWTFPWRPPRKRPTCQQCSASPTVWLWHNPAGRDRIGAIRLGRFCDTCAVKKQRQVENAPKSFPTSS